MTTPLPLAPPPLPKEHGAWVMLAMPIVFGAFLANGAAPAWLVAGAALAALLAEDALSPPVRRRLAGKRVPREKLAHGIGWGALYVTVAAAAFVGALVATPTDARPTLVGVSAAAGAAGLVFAIGSLAGRRKSIPFELAGMAGFAAVAPMMGLVGGETELARLAPPTVVAFGYSASALAYVRAYRDRSDDRLRPALVCLVAHAAIALLALFALERVAAGAWPLAALAPAFARTLIGLARPPSSLKRLGMTELFVAVAVVTLGVIWAT